MRKNLVVLSFLSLITVMFLLVGCSLFAPPAGQFASGAVSLHYPNGWTTSTSNSNYIVTIADPQNSAISVIAQKQQLPSGSDTQQAHSNLVNSMSPTQIVTATAACSLGGNPAYETYFISRGLEFRVTSLQKDNFLYSVVSSAPPDIFIKNQANFDIIVNSFRLQ